MSLFRQGSKENSELVLQEKAFKIVGVAWGLDENLYRLGN